MSAAADALQTVSELWAGLGLTAPAVELREPDDLPSPYRALLVHQAGMTATLARRWGEPIEVELLSDELSANLQSLFRLVVLRPHSTAEAVEIAIIRIPLATFTPILRARFLEAERPFGTLLAEAGIRFQARPQAYFTCLADAVLGAWAGLSKGTRLYGRINQLIRDDGVLLCETAEALPRA